MIIFAKQNLYLARYFFIRINPVEGSSLGVQNVFLAAGWKERGLVSEKELFALQPKEAVNSGDISRDLIELITPNKSQASIKQCAAKTGGVV